MKKKNQDFPVCTCYFAAIGHSHCAEAVVRNSCNLSSAASTVVVVAVNVRVRHGVWVI